MSVTAKSKSKQADSVKRDGAGRPKGSGKFGVPTKVIRVPVHLVDDIIAFITRKVKKA
jgi:hypothetical protein